MSITIGGSILGERAINEATRIVRDFQVREVNDEEGTIEAVVSTRDVDRYRSIILPSSIDRFLSRFLANPMFLWMHNRSAPIGIVQRIWRDEDKVYALFKFDLKNPFAAGIFRLYKEKILRAFSISGAAHQVFYYWQSPKERAALRELDESAYEALDSEECAFVIVELELYEISAVTVPGNHNALSRALADGLIDQELAEQLGGSGRDAHQDYHARKETPVDQIPKKLIERMDAITAAAEGMLEERKALEAERAEGLTEKQREQVRQCVLDTIAEVYATGDEEA